MQPPPYDRALVLASLVRTMRDHFLEVDCECGARRVVGVGTMARNARVSAMSMAHVALTMSCTGCREPPTRVRLTATSFGTELPRGGGDDPVWVIDLVERPPGGSRRMRVQP